ncbi:cupin domain-containing protein [Microbacterium sp. A84]|uniref:cupin domain-containing protein n=1 Tax=Microbacterium sp. A84 TaxID=3450715 RepID=UPI003F41FABE
MCQSVDTTNAEHYVWGGVSDGWRLLDKPGLSVTEERVPPGAGEEWHAHDTATQFFYVLEGAPQIQTAEGTVELGPRSGVEIPSGLAHRFLNPGPAETRFLVISSPSTRGDRRPIDRCHSNQQES